jgi:hypothetical protein
MRVAAYLVVVVIAGGLAVQNTDKKPVPDAQAQEKARALVRDVFKSDYATKSAERRAALARALLKQLETENDAAAQFALLQEAEEIALPLGEVELGLQAASELAARFEVDGDREKAKVLDKVVAFAKSVEAQKLIADEALVLARRALSTDDFDQALKRVAIAEKAATRTKEAAATTAVRKRRDEILAAKTRFAKIARFAETLQKQPDDPEANGEFGRYECYIKNDWQSGLPHLAKGSDAALRTLAEKTLNAANDPQALAAIAGGWWDVAEKLTGLERESVREFSAARYREALPNLSGFAKSVAEKRLAGVEKAAAARLGRRTIDLFPLIDVTKDSVYGTWSLEAKTVRCETVNFVPRLQIPYQPPEEYDFTVAFTQPKLRNGISLIMPNKHGGSFFWAVGGGRGIDYCLSIGGSDAPTKLPAGMTILPNTTHTTTVQVRRDGVTAFLDSRQILRYKTDFADLKADNWRDIKDKTLLAIACDDPTVFQTVQVVEISGPGKKTR